MILALNTAFMTANLSLYLDEKHSFVKTLDAKSKHSENVLKTIDELFSENKVHVQDIDKIAVVVGPGSFTGIRIGVSIVKALGSIKEDLKIIPVSTLDLMAYIMAQQNPKEEFVCVLNALSDLFFVAKYNLQGIKIDQERMIERQELDKLKETKVSVKGDLPNFPFKQIEITSEDLLNFALKCDYENNYIPVEKLAPVYLRLSQAEANLEKKNGQL